MPEVAEPTTPEAPKAAKPAKTKKPPKAKALKQPKAPKVAKPPKEPALPKPAKSKVQYAQVADRPAHYPAWVWSAIFGALAEKQENYMPAIPGQTKVIGGIRYTVASNTDCRYINVQIESDGAVERTLTRQLDDKLSKRVSIKASLLPGEEMTPELEKRIEVGKAQLKELDAEINAMREQIEAAAAPIIDVIYLDDWNAPLYAAKPVKPEAEAV